MKNTAAPRIALTAIVLLALAMIAPPAFALPKTRHVGPSKADCDYGRIQDAIDNVSSGDTIIVDAGGTYGSQHLNIANKSLAIGAGPCSLVIGGRPEDTQANSFVTLTGDASATSAVITVSGSGSLALNDLKITGNTHVGGNGGGIAFSSTGSLTLNNVTVSGNTAGSGGGGIAFYSSGKLTLNNTILSGNTANDGGGADVSGGKLVIGDGTQIIGNRANGVGGGGGFSVTASQMTAAGTGNLIANNHAANGAGGALRLDGSTATITAGGIGTQPVFFLNDAKNGGAIAVLAESFGSTALNLGDVGGTPIVIDNNYASQYGGGLYLQSDASQTRSADASAFNVRFTNNDSPDGAAIYSGCYSGGSCTPINTIDLESDGCQPGDCSAIVDNVATAASGAIVSLTKTTMDMSNTRISGNHGALLIGVLGSSTVTAVETLIANNSTTQSLISIIGSLRLSQCTFADNDVGGMQMIGIAGALEFINSIIASNVNAVAQTTGTLSAHGIVGNNVAGLPTQSDILLSDPGFLDAAHGDYRLRAITDGKALSLSPAIDFAAASDTAHDLDGRPRPKDLATAANKFGTYDVGAFEMQPITDRLFANGYGDQYLLAQ